jgi:hypothetical protein
MKNNTKKYYLKSHGLFKGFVNYNGRFFSSTKDETPWTKTKFTIEEILQIAEKYPEDVGNFEMIEVK